jgi:hypothetical protein
VSETSSKIITDALASEIVQQTKLHVNLSQEAIVITEDKVRLCLIAHLRGLEAKRDWIAPTGVLLTIIGTFATTTFHDAGLSAAAWQAIYIISGIMTLGWLGRALLVAWKAPTMEDVVASMKRAGAVAISAGGAKSTSDA